MDARLERLESKLALAEDLLDVLNRTVFRQQQQIEQLQRQVLALRERAPGGPQAPADPRDEIPPHW